MKLSSSIKSFPELQSASACELLELALMSNAQMRARIDDELNRRARRACLALRRRTTVMQSDWFADSQTVSA